MIEQCLKMERSLLKWIASFSIVLCFAPFLQAQSKLEGYIQEGLQSNQSLKQQEFLLEKNLYALKEARSLFLPNVSFNANYYLARGGRTIDLPLGDLLNPVYSTLNQFTESNAFPQLENRRELLNPNDFYDVKLRTTYPLLNAEISHNRNIKQQQFTLQKIELDLFKRELVKDIKTAYYQYLQASRAIGIYENTLILVKESLRINTSLYNNQKINKTAVIRAESEVVSIESQLETAKQTQKSAQAYFNFLLNRASYTPIEMDQIEIPATLDNSTEISVQQREEILKLKEANQISKEIIALNIASKKPKINLFADVGSQAFNFQFNNRSLYYFGGISLEWNLFTAQRNNHKIKQAELESASISANISYVEQQLQLQLLNSIHNFNASKAQYQAALTRAESTEKYYNDIVRSYKEGTVLYIELLDAQNQFITAQLQKNIALYDTWIKKTAIERSQASFEIK